MDNVLCAIPIVTLPRPPLFEAADRSAGTAGDGPRWGTLPRSVIAMLGDANRTVTSLADGCCTNGFAGGSRRSAVEGCATAVDGMVFHEPVFVGDEVSR
jgi:hypothetical protein